MKPPFARALMIALSLIGLADSAYLADMAFVGKDLVCNINGLDGCNTVAQSAYSWAWGYPLGLYGVIFYVLFLAALLLHKRIPRKAYRILLIALSLLGVAFSTYFVYLQQFVIQALCIYCLGSALVSYLLAYIVFREDREVVAGDSTPVVP